MRRALLAAAGLSLLATACGTTVPLTSQQVVGAGSGLGGASAAPVEGGYVGGSGTSAGTPGAGAGQVSAPGAPTAGSGSGGTTRPTGTSTTAAPSTVVPTSAVDYTRPATGSPVDVGIMYIADLAAVSAQFGASGSAFSQTDIMKKSVAWMNAHGGLGGHKINLLMYGAEIAGSKSYDQSLAEMCQMMTQDHHAVASVISNITVTNGMATCMEKAKALYVTDGGYFKSASTWQSLSYTASPTELEAEVLGRQMAQSMLDKGAAKRGDSVGLVVYDAPGFHAAETAFTAVAKAAGVETIPYAIHYATSTPDLATSISAVQSAVLAHKARGAKVVASLSSGGMMGYYLQNADQQQYYPRYLLSSNDGPVAAPAVEKNGQLKGAIAVGYLPTQDTDLYANPGAFAADATYNTCRALFRKDPSISTTANSNIAQRVCTSLLLVQTAAKGYGGTDITGTHLRDGLRRLGSAISAGTTYRTVFAPGKAWAPSAYRPMHYDEAKKLFVYDAAPLPFG